MNNIEKIIKGYKVLKIQMDSTLHELHQEILDITQDPKWLHSYIKECPVNGLVLVTISVLDSNKISLKYSVNDLLNYANSNDGLIDLYALQELVLPQTGKF